MENNEDALLKIESVLVDLKSSHFKLVEERDAIQTRLSEIKNITKEKSGTKKESEKIFRERTKLVEKLNQIGKQQNEIKQKIQKYSLMTSEIKSDLKQKRKEEINPENIILELKKLKSYYMGFSSDKSRVSSMRIMASEFAEKIDSIINEK